MGVDTSGGHPAMDYKEHLRTFNGFVQLTKFSVIACAVVLIGMAIFLV